MEWYQYVIIAVVCVFMALLIICLISGREDVKQQQQITLCNKAKCALEKECLKHISHYPGSLFKRKNLFKRNRDGNIQKYCINYYPKSLNNK